MKDKVLLIISKSLVFAFSAIWILGLLVFGLLLYPPLIELLELEGLYITVFSVWYVTTMVLIGISIALLSFKLVGSWKDKEAK